MISLLVGMAGCTEDPASEDPTETGETGTTTDDPGTTTSPQTTAPDPTGGGESDSGTTASTSPDDTSGGGEEESSGSTGEPPPVGSPGCGMKPTLEDGEQQLMLDGNDRRYVLRLPENYDPETPWPLIFALHGNGGNPGYWDGGGDRNIREAFATEAILVIPEAINNAWRDYGAPEDTWPEGIELELNFFDTVYDTMQNELCIDTENVFSMGFSGGGSFSGVLGCRRDYIRAMAVGGSVIYFEPEDCVATPAAWITIGDGELNAGREAFRDFFRDEAGCAEASMPGDPDGCVDYDGCGAETPVTFCAHPAGHVWPSIGTDATKAFFQQFYQAG